MNSAFTSTYTAFQGGSVVARGAYAAIAKAVAARQHDADPLLVFDDATGAPVDAPPTPEQAVLLNRRKVSPANLPTAGEGTAASGDDGAARSPPGRPRLGVVAREVTLLPRHWEWLAVQPGGASAALRKLVDQARKTSENNDAVRQAGERSYKFMSAIAGHRPEFEEAARALFAANRDAFTAQIASWPQDVRQYREALSDGAFIPFTNDKAKP